MKGDARRQDRHHALQIDEMESVNMLHRIVNRLCMFTRQQDNTRLNKHQTKQETPSWKQTASPHKMTSQLNLSVPLFKKRLTQEKNQTQTTTIKMRQIKEKDKTQHTQQKWSLRGWCNEDDTTRHDCVGKTSLFKVTSLEVDVKKDEHRVAFGKEKSRD